MSTKKHIEQEAEKTLQALDELQPAKTDAFFYSRLSAKLENRNEPDFDFEPENSWNFGFTFSVAVVLLILSINLMSISQYYQTKNYEETGIMDITEELAYDYQVFDLSYYDSIELEEE